MPARASVPTIKKLENSVSNKHDTIVDHVFRGALEAVGEIGKTIVEIVDPPSAPSPEERIADAIKEIVERDK